MLPLPGNQLAQWWLLMLTWGSALQVSGAPVPPLCRQPCDRHACPAGNLILASSEEQHSLGKSTLAQLPRRLLRPRLAGLRHRTPPSNAARTNSPEDALSRVRTALRWRCAGAAGHWERTGRSRKEHGALEGERRFLPLLYQDDHIVAHPLTPRGVVARHSTTPRSRQHSGHCSK